MAPSAAPKAPKAPVNAAEAAALAAAAESAAALAAKKKAAAQADAPGKAADGGPPKISSMEIKKLNGDGLKEALKARNLDVQGQKKDLIKRLCDYEAARP